MSCLISMSALSASKKPDALFDALSLRRLMISILEVKCIKCINILVTIHVSLTYPMHGMVEWLGVVLMHLMHFEALHTDHDALLMHCRCTVEALHKDYDALKRAPKREAPA